MALMTLHREELYGLNREAFRAKLAELQAKYPAPATVTYRRFPNYGAGYTFFVKGEKTPTVVQLRGHCQFCGHDQVVKDGVLVLHGYKRPGHGWIYGRCPGAAKLPLQSDESITRAALAEAQARHQRLDARHPALVQAEKTAEARYMAEEPGKLYAKPDKPYRYPEPKGEEKEQIEREYAAKLAAWFKRHPATKAYLDAVDARRSNEQARQQSADQILHFETLLGWKLLGTPLVEKAVR